MFENGLIGKNNFWRYLLVLFCVFITTQIVSGIVLSLGLGIDGVTALGNQDYAYLFENGFTKNYLYALFMVPFAIGFFALLLFIRWIQKKSFTSITTGFKEFRWRRFSMGFGIWAILSLISFVLGFLLAPDDYVLQFDAQKFFILFILSVLLLPLQTGLEELLFRGYLLQGFQQLTKSKWASVIITSVLFALLHILNPEVKEFGFALAMGMYLSLGLLFGILTLKDNGLELAWGVHFANNLLVALFVTHKSSALQTDAIFAVTRVDAVEGLIGTVVSVLLMYFVCQKVFAWNQEKKENLAQA